MGLVVGLASVLVVGRLGNGHPSRGPWLPRKASWNQKDGVCMRVAMNAEAEEDANHISIGSNTNISPVLEPRTPYSPAMRTQSFSVIYIR